MYLHVCGCIYIYIYLHIYIYIHMYVHTHDISYIFICLCIDGFECICHNDVHPICKVRPDSRTRTSTSHEKIVGHRTSLNFHCKFLKRRYNGDRLVRYMYIYNIYIYIYVDTVYIYTLFVLSPSSVDILKTTNPKVLPHDASKLRSSND